MFDAARMMPISLPPDKVREHILAAATAMFIERGLSDTSIDAIAAEANSSKKTIYKHFDNKIDLFRCAIRHRMREGPAVFEPDAADSGSMADMLRAYCRWTYDRALTTDSFGLYRASIEAASAAPDAAADIRDSFRDTLHWPLQYFGRLTRSEQLLLDDIPAAAADLGLIAVNGTAHLMGWPIVDVSRRALLAEWATAFFLGGFRELCHLPSAGEQVVPPLLRESGTLAEVGSSHVYDGGRLAPDRIEHLMDTAAKEFLVNGMRRGSVDEVSRVSGVSKMTIYRHFGDKRGLFIGTVEYLMRRSYSSTDAVTSHAETATFADHLMEIGRKTLARFVTDDNIDLYRLMIREASRFPELALAVYRRSNEAAMLGVIQGLMAQPECRNASRSALEYLAVQFVTLVTNANKFLSLPIRPEAIEQERLVARTVDLFLNGHRARLRPTGLQVLPAGSVRPVGTRRRARQ